MVAVVSKVVIWEALMLAEEEETRELAVSVGVAEGLAVTVKTSLAPGVSSTVKS